MIEDRKSYYLPLQRKICRGGLFEIKELFEVIQKAGSPTVFKIAQGAIGDAQIYHRLFF